MTEPEPVKGLENRSYLIWLEKQEAEKASAEREDVVDEVDVWFKRDTLAFRMWIYRIVTALLVIVSGWRGWEFIDTGDIARLAEAILGVGVASVTHMANRHVK